MLLVLTWKALWGNINDIRISQKYKTYQECLIYKIFKSLYRLKQTEKLWNKILIKFFQKIGFVPSNADLCILVCQQSDIFIIIRVYINDPTIASQN